MSTAPQRQGALRKRSHWLEEPPGQRVCRVLSNAKCLTEGVDVPDLDAVHVPQPAQLRRRRRPGGRPSHAPCRGQGIRLRHPSDRDPRGMPPEEALRDNKRYTGRLAGPSSPPITRRSVRRRDQQDRHQQEHTRKSSSIGIGLPAATARRPGRHHRETGEAGQPTGPPGPGAMARRACTRRSSTRSATAVHGSTGLRTSLGIAERQEIASAPARPPRAEPGRRSRVRRVPRRRSSINLTTRLTDDAIGMLSQHLITRPVFEALFAGDDFTHEPRVPDDADDVDTLDDATSARKRRPLDEFYDQYAC